MKNGFSAVIRGGKGGGGGGGWCNFEENALVYLKILVAGLRCLVRWELVGGLVENFAHFSPP